MTEPADERDLRERWAERRFPLQADRSKQPGPRSIPWCIAEEAYAAYSALYGHGQSLERLAERGGFGWLEMDSLLPGWRERCDVLTKALADIALLQQRLAEARHQREVAEIAEQNETRAYEKARDNLNYLRIECDRVVALLQNPFVKMPDEVRERINELAADLKAAADRAMGVKER